MKHIKFFGASDDLVEVEGKVKGCDEFNSEKETFSLCGLIITVEYTSNGTWGICIHQVDEDIPVTAQNIQLSVQPRSNGEPGYSMALDMDVPDDTYLNRLHQQPQDV